MAKKIKQAAHSLPIQGVWWTNGRLVAGLLFALAFVLYANTLPNGFVLDDAVVITKNQFTAKGIAGIPDILTTHAFEGYYAEDLQWIQVYGARYRPLSMVGFAIIYQFFGANSFLFHLWNVLLYGLCCAFLYVVLRKIFNYKLNTENSAIFAGLATLIFTLHPIHTEVVANIKSNDEISALLLSLLSLYLAIKYQETGNKAQAFFSGFVLLLACLAKENSITFLAIIPLTLYWIGDKKKRSALTVYISLGAATVAYFFIRNAVIGIALGEPPMDLINNPFVKYVNGTWVRCDLHERLAMTFYSLGKYLQLLVFPHPLSTDYYPRYVDLMKFSNPGALISLVLYLAMGIYVAIKLIKKEITPVVYGMFFFLATFSIVSNLVFPIGTNLAERFLYMPSVGFCIVVAYFSYPLLMDKGHKYRKILLPIMAVVALLFSIKTITRNFDFESNKTLFYKDIEVSETSAKIQHAIGANMAEEALKINSPIEKAELAKKAKIHLDKAIEIHPTYLEVFYMRANVYFMLGNYEAAVLDYRSCLALNPNFKKATGNYALALREAARNIINQNGDIQKAIAYLDESLKLFPEEQETIQLLNAAKSMN